MRKNIISIFLSCLIILMSYCPMVSAKEEQEEEESEIVIIERSLNFAWGYYDTGIFIDDKGNVYEFDFSENYYDDDWEFPTDEELLKILYDILENEEPVDKVNIFCVSLCDTAADIVDENAKLIEEHYAYDMGQKTLYVVDDERHIIEVSSEGDFNVYRDDLCAIIISWIYKCFIH